MSVAEFRTPAAESSVDHPAQGAEPRRRAIQPGTRLWEEIGLVTFSLTGGTAFLLQTMDPTIGTVVGEHSTFRTDAVGRATRSLASVMTWVYGGEEALVEADRLRTMHATLNSTDEQGVRHKALSSGPWAWVLLTGSYAFTEGARYFSRRPLTDQEKEDYYQENLQIMRNLYVAEKEIPQTYAEFQRKFEQIVDERLVAHPTAYDFLKSIAVVPPPPKLPRVFRPAWRAVTGPVGKLQYFVTVGTTPERAREKLGLEWNEKDERNLRRIGWVVARLVPRLPERLRYLPIAYEARKVERDKQRLHKMLEFRPM
ncbi:DUF2236 domain-containing protein [Aldersonia sp. NBC_00410]|uniref:oxygenase MpaB family protein n=1 Tax=Aldersonia sp. NBC_00410 TaxID=2975954 RepID=UPI0022571E01|nr:oxygenase MpaB family protein [Aldersonia sp. NBC_00410]MCX5044995.1 DUF2236 domain-containing protein [Aldersonia sp. NBC_00410]